MERKALPTMALILQENAFPRRKLLGIRPSEIDRHQTEPVPRLLKGNKAVGVDEVTKSMYAEDLGSLVICVITEYIKVESKQQVILYH